MKLYKLSVVSVFSALLALPISISFAAKTTYTSTHSTGKKGGDVNTSVLKTYSKKGIANTTTKTTGTGSNMSQVGKTSQKNYKGGSVSSSWAVKDGKKVRQSYTVKKDNGNAIRVTTKNPVTQKMIYPKGRQVMLSTGDKKVVRIKKGNTGVKITKEGSSVNVKKGTLPQTQ